MKECYEVKEVRKVLNAAREAGFIEKFRIRQNGSVEIYGVMPNTDKEGWFYGGNAVTESRTIIQHWIW